MSITADNFEMVSPIRSQMVLDAREAVRLGVYDMPGIFDAALDNLIDRAEAEERVEEARQRIMSDEFDRMCESDA